MKETEAFIWWTVIPLICYTIIAFINLFTFPNQPSCTYDAPLYVMVTCSFVISCLLFQLAFIVFVLIRADNSGNKNSYKFEVISLAMLISYELFSIGVVDLVFVILAHKNCRHGWNNWEAAFFWIVNIAQFIFGLFALAFAIFVTAVFRKDLYPEFVGNRLYSTAVQISKKLASRATSERLEEYLLEKQKNRERRGQLRGPLLLDDFRILQNYCTFVISPLTMKGLRAKIFQKTSKEHLKPYCKVCDELYEVGDQVYVSVGCSCTQHWTCFRGKGAENQYCNRCSRNIMSDFVVGMLAENRSFSPERAFLKDWEDRIEPFMKGGVPEQQPPVPRITRSNSIIRIGNEELGHMPPGFIDE